MCAQRAWPSRRSCCVAGTPEGRTVGKAYGRGNHRSGIGALWAFDFRAVRPRNHAYAGSFYDAAQFEGVGCSKYLDLQQKM